MKIALQKSPISTSKVFEIKFLKEPHFDANWHFHSEYQLFIVLKGTGTRFIGDHVKPFKEGDLVFTGPNLPHLWRSDMEYFDGDPSLWTEGVVIYFQESFLGDQFLDKNEFFRIRQLFAKAKQGMEIRGKTAEEIRHRLVELLALKDFESVLAFLHILNVLAHTAEYVPLATDGYTNTLKESDTERINKVHTYVMKNFRERISLSQVASVASMTSSSFSRYFKMHANKTFSSFLTEIRIGHASKLLIEKKMAISQACYESGFQTLSNFNRQFKAVTNHSPLEYKRIYNETKS